MIFKGVRERRGERTVGDKPSHHCRHVHAPLGRKHCEDYNDTAEGRF